MISATLPGIGEDLPEPSSRKGYNAFGGDRSVWAVGLAVDQLLACGHQLDSVAPVHRLSTRCKSCLLSFPATRLLSLAKEGEKCKGDLFSILPGPLSRSQSLAPGLEGFPYILFRTALDPSHSLKHYGGLVWCSWCGCGVSVVTESGQVAVRGLTIARRGAKSKFAAALRRLDVLKLPHHLLEWPAATNLSLRGFVGD